VSSQLIRNIAGNELTYVGFRNNLAIDVKYEPESMNQKKSVASLREFFRIIDETCGQQGAKSSDSNPFEQLKVLGED
jgi:hypothetical protein